jgi:serine/threonine-protein kinase
MRTPGVHAPVRLGRYELLARLATGGMGQIFLGRLEGAAGFEKLFVVKRILPHLADDARFRAMLIGEARLASRMSHANICQVYELGETDGQLYIVMEHLEGLALLSLLRAASRRGVRLELGLVGGVVQQCTDALHYAHELRDRDGGLLGIVHRDITPGNIFVTEPGVVKLLDFGIAKVKDASVTTQTGTVKGKHAYMAPEQLRGATIDRRADLFALGIVIFEMLALRRLFQRRTDYLTFHAVIEDSIPDVRRYRPDVPAALAEALGRALERDAERRPATARQLGASIMDALAPVQRPWSQGDIADFLHAQLAAELAKQRGVIAAAIRRSTDADERETTPMQVVDADGTPTAVALDDAGRVVGNGDEDEEEGVFPNVADSPPAEEPAALAGAAALVEDEAAGPASPTRVLRQSPAPGSGTAPPPIGAVAVAGASMAEAAMAEAAMAEAAMAEAAMADASMADASMAAPAAAHRRGLMWPLLALAMAAITAIALVLVWKQAQQPKKVIITSEAAAAAAATDPPVDAAGSASDAAAATAAGGSGSAGAGSAAEPAPPPAQPVRKPPPSNPYTAVVKSYGARMSKCVEDDPLPPGNVKMVIVIAPSGRPKTVSFEPSSLDSTRAGACIRDALSTAKFPATKDEQKITVPVSVPAKRS